MSNNIQIGVIRLATLATYNGTRANTYFLPPPDNETGLQLEWIEKGFNTDLIDGSECNRRLGWVPELTLTYKIYDDVNAKYGYVIGNANGNQLDFVSLLSILDSAPGYISVSPGLSSGGFIINKATVAPYNTLVGGLAANVTITLRSGTIYSTKILSTF